MGPAEPPGDGRGLGPAPMDLGGNSRSLSSIKLVSAVVKAAATVKALIISAFVPSWNL